MRCEYEEEHPGVNNVQLTLARAKALVGKVGYNLLKDNCEHFATFCKLGSFHSWQVCYALRKAYIALIETLSNAAKLCAAKSAAVVTSASRTAVNMVDDVAGSAVAGGTRSLGVLMQGIGFGIVVVIQGIYFTIDAVKLFKDKRKGKLTDMAFKAYVWKSFISTLERVFYTGGIPAAGSLILSLFNPCTGALIGGMLVAAIVGSALATCTGGFDHTFMGRTMSVCTRPIMLYRSLSVASVNELSPGDHIVIPQWLLHPRCHAIVVRVVSDDDALEVIRFTYEKGVVREKIKFTTPSYKVLYEKGKSFDSETVIKRAKEKIGSTKLVYKILQNN
ncbi:hypothetical protein BSL78_09361 [Apostichopus japonicus]|uniref:LRAT domain-containing protein n=1 Tax=Stichopus japonicus TaxID=307972 RepID=A0A2G8L0K4_STIJA|nr:hypothetical protein BSL78_09361 [Apostichopus japonicus]